MLFVLKVRTDSR